MKNKHAKNWIYLLTGINLVLSITALFYLESNNLLKNNQMLSGFVSLIILCSAFIGVINSEYKTKQKKGIKLTHKEKRIIKKTIFTIIFIGIWISALIVGNINKNGLFMMASQTLAIIGLIWFYKGN